MREPTCVIEEITDAEPVIGLAALASDPAGTGRGGSGGATETGASGAAAPCSAPPALQHPKLSSPATAAAAEQPCGRDGGALPDQGRAPPREAGSGGDSGAGSSGGSQAREETLAVASPHESDDPPQQQQQQQQDEDGEHQQWPAPEAAGEAAPPPAAPWAPADAAEASALQSAEDLKKAGNDLYASDRWDEAVAKYQQALDLAPPGAPQRAIYYANLGACCLKLEQPALAAEHCSCALRIDDGYVKALMRRSAAFEAMDDPEHALTDAKKVLELDPSNAWAAATAARLAPAVAERQEKLKAEMLGKLKDLGNSLLGKFGLSLDNFKAEQDPATGGYSIKFQQ